MKNYGLWWGILDHFFNLLWVWGLSEGLIPFGCCSRKGIFRLRVAFQRRWVFADLEGFLICLGSFPWQFQWSQMARHREWLSFRSRSWRRFAFHLWVWGLSEGLIPFGCCSRKGIFRLRVAFQRRWVFADLEGFLICLGSFPWQFQWSQMARHREWLSSQLGS